MLRCLPACLLLGCLLLTAPAVTADIRQQAIDLGAAIDRNRQQSPGRQQLDDMLAQTGELAARARAARLSREAAAGENEQRLEQLYRSPIWSDIGFALAAARYWRAWLLLDRYRLHGVQTDLERARKDFQTTLVLIVYPGLVRGSWLGLGYVALSEGQYKAAETWFNRVAAQDHPLAEQANRELELLAALNAPLPSQPAEPVAAAELTAQQLDQLENDALALLERHGRTLDGASRAALRLLQLEAAGALNRQRVTRLLAYRDEIIGHPIGPVGLLVSAENALDHQQYYTAVEHYRKFFAALDAARRLEFADYQLRYADALIASGLAAEAAELLKPELLPHVTENTSYFSLRHLALATVYAQSGGAARRGAALRASEEASRANPQQPADPGAGFVSALLSGEIARARTTTAEHRADRWLLRLPLFELAYRELHQPAETSQRTELAEFGLQLFRRLPKDIAGAPWALLAEAEMRGYVQTSVEQHLAYLDRLSRRLSKDGHPKADELFALRAAYLRRTDAPRLLDELADLQPPVSAPQRDTLVRELLDCDPDPWCGAATRRLISLLQAGSAQMLYARLQQVRLLSQAAEIDQAYQQAAKLIAEYPASGDALYSYAAAAAAVGRAADADAAYGRIAQSLPVGSDDWRDARRQQLALRLRAAQPREVCALQALAYGDKLLAAEIRRGLQAAEISCNLPIGGVNGAANGRANGG